jgi:hypothetical protein
VEAAVTNARNTKWSREEAIAAAHAVADGDVCRSSDWWSKNPSHARPSKQAIFKMFQGWPAFAEAAGLLTPVQGLQRARERREVEQAIERAEREARREERDRERREARQERMRREQGGRESPRLRRARERAEGKRIQLEADVAAGIVTVRTVTAADLAALDRARARRLAYQPTDAEIGRGRRRAQAPPEPEGEAVVLAAAVA